MSNELIVKEVNFLNTDLLAIQQKETGKIYTAINFILRGLGFDEKQIEYQKSKWVNDKVISKGTLKFSGTLVNAKTGKDILCISLTKLPLALAKINITPKMQKDMPQLTEKLEAYQDKCADILADAFLPEAYIHNQSQSPAPVFEDYIHKTFKFKSQDVEVLKIDDQLLFNMFHIGRCLEMRDEIIKNFAKAIGKEQLIRFKIDDVYNYKVHNGDCFAL